MTKSLKGKSWLMTLPLAIVAVAYVYWIFLPGQQKIGDIRAELKTHQDFVASSQFLASSIKLAEAELRETNLFVERWKERSPDVTDLSQLFGQINAAAKLSGTRTTRFDPQVTEQSETLRRIPLVVEVAGSYDGIFDFLHRLEAFPATVWVDDMRLESLQKDGKEIKCELTLAIFAANPKKSD
jgi:Tfp pilus assembly protein PilO